MVLLAIYVVLVVIGEVIAIQIGLFLDGTFPTVSIPIALSLFFAVMALAWPIAVAIHDRWRPEAKA